MKVYACPDAVPPPKVDYSKGFDLKKKLAAEKKHMADLKRHLKEMGYTGKYTGEIARFGVADGYALYMLADGKGQYGGSFLIHLPYGDAYQYYGIQHFPKAEIIRTIEGDKRLAAAFRKAKGK